MYNEIEKKLTFTLNAYRYVFSYISAIRQIQHMMNFFELF